MGEDLLPGTEHGIGAIAIEQLEQAAFADAPRVAHGLQITFHDVGHAHVPRDQAHDFSVDFTGSPQLAGQDPDALLVELRHALHGLGTGRRASHVHLMGAIHHVAHELVAMKHRGGEEEIRKMAGTHVEVVEHDRVSRAQVGGRVFGQDVSDQRRH